MYRPALNESLETHIRNLYGKLALRVDRLRKPHIVPLRYNFRPLADIHDGCREHLLPTQDERREQ